MLADNPWTLWVGAPQKQGVPRGTQSWVQHVTAPLQGQQSQVERALSTPVVPDPHFLHSRMAFLRHRFLRGGDRHVEKPFDLLTLSFLLVLITWAAQNLSPSELTEPSTVLMSAIVRMLETQRSKLHILPSVLSEFMGRDLEGHSVLHSPENHQADRLPSTHR